MTNFLLFRKSTFRYFLIIMKIFSYISILYQKSQWFFHKLYLKKEAKLQVRLCQVRTFSEKRYTKKYMIFFAFLSLKVEYPKRIFRRLRKAFFTQQFWMVQYCDSSFIIFEKSMFKCKIKFSIGNDSTQFKIKWAVFRFKAFQREIY